MALYRRYHWYISIKNPRDVAFFVYLNQTKVYWYWPIKVWGVIFTKSIIKIYSVYLMTRVVRLHLPNCWHSVTTVTPVISGSPLPSSKIWHSASFTDFSAVSRTFSAGPCSCPAIWHHSWMVNRFISKHKQEIWKVHGIAPAVLTYLLTCAIWT